jgi:copper(I)-binding protein
MKPSLRAALFALATAASAPTWAGVTVQDPWVRSTVSQQMPTGAFMQIRSDQATRLVEVSSPAAKTVQIHEMSMQGDVMKMRAIKGLDVPADKPVELKPGSYHIMLMDLTAQIKAGDTVPLTLVFEGADKKRETVTVKATARSPMGGPQGQGMRDKMHEQMHDDKHHHAD